MIDPETTLLIGKVLDRVTQLEQTIHVNENSFKLQNEFNDHFMSRIDNAFKRINQIEGNRTITNKFTNDRLLFLEKKEEGRILSLNAPIERLDKEKL